MVILGQYSLAHVTFFQYTAVFLFSNFRKVFLKVLVFILFSCSDYFFSGFYYLYVGSSLPILNMCLLTY